MSQENVDTVLESCEAFNRGDFRAAVEHAHPDAEWHVLAVMPDAQVCRGPEDIIRFFEMWHDSFEDFRIELERTLDLGDRVLTLLTASGSARGSQAGVRSPTFGQIWTFDGGQVTRVEMLLAEEALKAVGLEE